jgi:hypothetical protein
VRLDQHLVIILGPDVLLLECDYVKQSQ